MTEQLTIDDNQVTWTKSADGVVLLNLSTSRYSAVNETGSILWAALADGTTREALVSVLRRNFPEVDDIRATADVDEFIAAVEAQGLLVRRHASDA